MSEDPFEARTVPLRPLAVASLVALIAVVPSVPTLAADPVEDWGSSGVAQVPAPPDGFSTDTDVLTDGRVVVVGGAPAGAWGRLVAADGRSSIPLSGAPATTADRYDAVAATSDAIYAIGSVEVGLGTTGLVHVFGPDGTFRTSGSINISEDTLPANAVHDGAGSIYVAGAGRGDDDGVEPGWVVRLTPGGEVDPAFEPQLLTNPVGTGSTAWVGATRGSVVAAVWGDDDSGAGAAIGFHRIRETGSTFMADLYTSTDIVDVDMDSTSGWAVFGTLSEGSPGAPAYSLTAISATGATAGTATGTWVDAAGVIEAGRLRPDDRLGAHESDNNTAVENVTESESFAVRADAELVDLATLRSDGSVFLTVDVPGGDLAEVVRYQGDTSGRFLDDDGSVHESDIEALASLGVARGCNPPVDDRYCPAQDITRGQMAAFLNRAFDLPPGTEDAFDDDDDSVFEADIDAIARAGLTIGCNPPANDRYCPTDHVTREQMASFLVRALD